MEIVASECCGSCGWYCWNSYLSKYNCHNPELVKQHKQDDFIPESLCVPNYYSPRNPIPIIDLPGVKELVEKQRRHRKWALKEMKEKQALWRNYCGEVSELMDEVKRLKAMLAIGHFVIRE